MRFVREAVELAIQNLNKRNGGPFGAVVVKDGVVIARGVNTVTTGHDPTAHAEISAIREACRVLESHQLTDCEIYCSCEPCPMCLGAIYWARPKKVYYGASRQDAARAGFDDEHIYEEMGKPFHLRRLPSEQISIPESQEVFRRWIESDHKIRY